MIKMSNSKKGLLNMLLLIPIAITAILMSAIIRYRIFNNIDSSFGTYAVEGIKIYSLVIALELIIGVMIAVLSPLFHRNTKRIINVMIVAVVLAIIGSLIYKI